MKSKSAITYHDNCLLVSGELNFETVVSLWEESLPLLANCPELCFDFSNITQSNSAGLALLLEWMKYAKQASKKITFSHLPMQLNSIASVAGVVMVSS